MAHFYGKLRGGRGEATRCGTRNSGVTTTAASWQGAVLTGLSYNEETGQDWATVSLTPWKGRGQRKLLYDGPVSGVNRPVESDA